MSTLQLYYFCLNYRRRGCIYLSTRTNLLAVGGLIIDLGCMDGSDLAGDGVRYWASI